MIGRHTPTHFIPSSADLLAMIANAERKCDADREQCALKREAQADARMVRAIDAEVRARRYAK